MKNKVVLITGAKGGLGNPVTRRFLDAGAYVAGVSLNISQADFPDANFMAIPANFSKAETVNSVVDSVVKRFGKLDVLVHVLGGFAGGKSVAVSAAAIPSTLLESEMFGHERGAFTDAKDRRLGKFELAHGGTLYLDEIGDMPLDLQAKVLRALQERTIERLGGQESIRVDVRVLAATNRDLEVAMRDGKFREDLYYRLNVVTLNLPPLRERRRDIPLLVDHFLAKHAPELGERGVAPEALDRLVGYEWPGNVRELENAIERAIVLGSGDVIETDDLPERILESTGASTKTPGENFYEGVRQAKREIILKALERAQGNYTEAAKALGMHPNNLHRLMRSLELKAAMGK